MQSWAPSYLNVHAQTNDIEVNNVATIGYDPLVTERDGRWLGVPARVALANADSVFRSAAPPDAVPAAENGGRSALSRRAGAVLAGAGVVVAYERGSAAPSQGQHTTVLVTRRSGDLCLDLADDGGAIDELRRACAGFPLPWTLWAQVFTPTADTLTLDLSRSGFSRSLLPRSSGGSVAYWNTKVGGAELLQGALPDAVSTTTCYSPTDIRTRIGTAGCARWVVKPDHGLGGHGVVFVDSSMDVGQIAELVAPTPTPDWDPENAPNDKKGGKSWLPGGANRYVVQPVIGDPLTNVSPTVDFWVGPTGAVRLLGYSDQILDDSVRYIGSRSSVTGSGVRRHLVDAGVKVGTELHANGYVGLFNLDAVYAADGTVAVVEINVRQSAPLDQSLTMSRRYGRTDDWELTNAFWAHEPGRAATLVTPPSGRLHAYGASHGDNGLTMAVAPRAVSSER
jgi:hypothetical protein